ncbi:hypothetical protein RV18_GL002742 [Enterococcus termitis]|nr:hypothetical protein RV18_GL002742 [Enterococcus termitis]
MVASQFLFFKMKLKCDFIMARKKRNPDAENHFKRLST